MIFSALLKNDPLESRADAIPKTETLYLLLQTRYLSKTETLRLIPSPADAIPKTETLYLLLQTGAILDRGPETWQ